MSKKAYPFFLFLLIFIKSQWVIFAESLESIPQKDKEIIESFFRSLFAEGDFAYTLFGCKPIAFIDYRIELKFLQAYEYNRKKANIAMRGVKIWNKYQHLFQMKNFHLISTKVPNNSFSIALVSKTMTKDAIKDNLRLFQESFSLQDTVDTIFDKVIQQWISNSVFGKEIFPKYYFQCLGILLGYGKANSEAFDKKATYQYLLTKAPIDPKLFENEKLAATIRLNSQSIHLPNQTYTIQTKALLSKLESVQNDYGYIKATFKNNPLCPIKTPSFMGIKNNPETSVIKKNYDQLLEKLMKIYYSENFLEIILERLTSAK